MAMKEKKEVDGIKIIDESGDRKHFAIIPYCVINGSGVYERAMYLEMKRRASEEKTGICFSSVRVMAKRLNIGNVKVIETIEKLINRGCIKKVGTKPTGGKPVNCYSIVNIWEANSKKYAKN